jgi:Tfp pilus assembly protein PilN
MPLINLIQEQRLAKAKREQQVRHLFIGVTAIGAVSVVTALFFTFEAVQFNAEASRLERKKEELQPKIDELDLTNRAIADLDPQIESLETAQKSTGTWWTILDHYRTSTPDDIWVREIRGTRPNSNGAVQVSTSGQSTTQESVGAFMLYLEACEHLDTATLKFTQEQSNQFGSSTGFEVTCNIAGTAPEKKKTLEEKI